MQGVEAYPLHWPAGKPRTAVHKRQHSRFGGRGGETTGNAIKRVMAQISLFTRAGQTWVIDPSQVVISTNLETRNDGLPRASQREPSDPGVAVYFRLRGKPHCLSCDRFVRVGDNLAAIAKHLEATRGIERWGVADIETLFSGFKALPAATVTEWKPTTAEQAAEWMARTAAAVSRTVPHSAANVLADRDIAADVYRIVARASHPDANGGKETQQWRVLNEAKALIDLSQQ